MLRMFKTYVDYGFNYLDYLLDSNKDRDLYFRSNVAPPKLYLMLLTLSIYFWGLLLVAESCFSKS